MLKAIDFFCGAGGVTCGFQKIGIDVLGGLDIDPKFEKTYEVNNKSLFINQDVSKLSLTPNRLSELLPIGRDDNNLIFVGCSPCQYFSIQRSNKTKSENSRLLLDDFKELVLYFRPGFVFIENVPGLETKKGSPLHQFKKALNKHGYVLAHTILNAKYFGVPQNRRRFVLIASRLNSSISLPKQICKKENLVTVREAIGNYNQFPKIVAGTQDNTSFLHDSSRLSDLNLKRVKRTPKNGGSRFAWAKDPELQLECHKMHDGHYDVYGRMAWEKQSPTITTRFSYTSTGRFSHPEQDRAISLREGATLQSFPLDYTFYSSNKGTIATMIGNAVPPKLAEAVGITLIEHWNKWQNSKQEHAH